MLHNNCPMLRPVFTTCFSVYMLCFNELLSDFSASRCLGWGSVAEATSAFARPGTTFQSGWASLGEGQGNGPACLKRPISMEPSLKRNTKMSWRWVKPLQILLRSTSSDVGRSKVEYSVECCNSYQTVLKGFCYASGNLLLVLRYGSCVKTLCQTEWKKRKKNILARSKVFCCKKFQEKSHDKDIGKTNKENLCKQIMEAWRAKKDMVGWILLLNISGIENFQTYTIIL